MADPREHERDETRLDEQVRAAYRQPVQADAASQARVLSQLAATNEPSGEPLARTRTMAGSRTGLRWWFGVRSFQLRPAWALVALVAVLGGGAWLGARLAPARVATSGTTQVPNAGAASTASAESPVTFVLRAPGATRVSVVGDFNSWDAEATPMAHSGTGDMWILNLTLPRGVHLYSFVLDGSEWRPDPSAPLAADDSFGGHNSVIVVNGAKGL